MRARYFYIYGDRHVDYGAIPPYVAVRVTMTAKCGVLTSVTICGIMCSKLKERGLNKMIVYKVVYKNEYGELASAAAEGEARVIYQPGIAASPPKWLAEHGYWLTAFETEESARSFKNINAPTGPCELWLAEAAGVKRQLPPYLPLGPLSYGALLTALSTSYGWPPGTVMVQQLTLLHKIE